MAFTPPLYKDIGKLYKDLSSKKFDYKYELKTVDKSRSDVSFESGVVSKSGGLGGNIKLTTNLHHVGKVTLESATCGSLKTTVENKSLVDGVLLKFIATHKPSFTVSSQYRQGNFSGVAEVEHGEKTNVRLNGVVGIDGLSVGGSVDVGCSGNLQDYSAALQYDGNGYQVAAKTLKQASKLSLSYHSFYKSQLIGSELAYNLSDGNVGFTGVTQFNLDADTTLKAKLDHTGVLSTAVEHRLFSPNLKVNLACSSNVLSDKPFAAEKFGVGLTFGDY